MTSLLIDPETELVFSLSKSEATPRCMMTLKHPGGSDEFVAFKVKTTQPRRYLVRPNQGLIGPGTSETISILLVEKDKQVLLQSYERLGQSGLDHSKDKFLVQSCPVDKAFAAKKAGDQTELYESLTTMWNTVTAGGSTTPVHNKKLHVRHVVTQEASAAAATARAAPKLEKAPHSNLKDMNPEQLATELSGLRRKYDELVSFSVNLTAERDILSNTLEQTKRDYNREMAARSALENKQGGGSARGGSGKGGKSGGASLFQMVFLGLACFLAGAKIGATGNAPYLPVVGNFFIEGDAKLVKVEPVSPPPTPEEVANDGGEL
ncbi:MSP major sperm protein domain containing protein [Nitzschia inconspicua]|uniref:MSP major sperm protein domain containing protein n=1 Tax=Nitzschia inconspicua TaxID=303405 RepID=A0A9K3PLX0_9STRA|nr:MSP major sperm protein domain containing protein [Nitzschia inconspicua]